MLVRAIWLEPSRWPPWAASAALPASLLLFIGKPIRDRVARLSPTPSTLLSAALLGLTPQALLPAAAAGDWPAHRRRRSSCSARPLAPLRDDHECDVHHDLTLVIIGDPSTRSSTASSLPRPCSCQCHRHYDGARVAAHEIPQEASDFAILLAAGARGRALLLNLSSAIGGVLGPTRC
jgi:hypothetical protein